MALTAVPPAGAKVRGSVLSALFSERTPIYAKVTLDQNVGPSNTVLQNVTDLAVSVAASATYEFMLAIQYGSNSTADFKMAFTYPTGLTMDYSGIGYTTAEAVTYFRGIESTTLQVGGSVNALHLFGTVVVSSTAGTLQVQAAQSTSTAVATNVEAGSYMRLLRIA